MGRIFIGCLFILGSPFENRRATHAVVQCDGTQVHHIWQSLLATGLPYFRPIHDRRGGFYCPVYGLVWPVVLRLGLSTDRVYGADFQAN